MTAVTPKIAVLGFLCLLQLAVPASMIGKREAALRTGAPYRFKTRPVDPHDPFRGRYVALQFEQDIAKLDCEQVERGQKLYVEVTAGDDGFARLGKASKSRPESGDYIKVRAKYETGGGTVNVTLPFDRYYMNESKASEAEAAYRVTNRGTNRNTFALVKVLDGMAVTEGLYIDGVHVLDYLAEKGER